MENNLLNDTLELLTEQMIKDYFKSKATKGEKYIVTKQDLYDFSMKLITLLIAMNGEIYNENIKTW